MSTNERFDESITGWLEQTAPARLPDRVLVATFERTRTNRQEIGWRSILGRPGVTRSVLALGGAAAVVAIAAVVALGVFDGRPAVGGPSPSSEARSVFAGTWYSTSDADGGTQTMTVRVGSEGVVEILVTDDIASVCSRTPSTMTGTGRIEGSTRLVIPTPVYTCDDGSEAVALSGPPLEDQLRNLTFVRDARAETLADAFGGVWLRDGAAAPSPAPRASDTVAPQPSDTMWPQSTLDEVRQAQELADAGDPAYTWQVDAQLSSDDYGKWERLANGQVELVDRFLREELGWEAYMQNGLDGGADNSLTDQRFLRCAPDRTNPLYPPQPDSRQRGESCAPTLDDLTYESVSLDLVQPDRQGPGGIWVVSNSRPTTFAQADPAVAEASATERLEKFLAARIAGRGAEGYVDVYSDWLGRQVPLLYATTSGAPYERSEFERVHPPTWPYGGYIGFSVRLFADDGATVVEQEITSHWDGGRSVGIEGGLALEGTATENGEVVPMTYGVFDGEITYSSPSPSGWAFGGSAFIDFTDPVVRWSECAQTPVPADAAGFAQAVAADADFQTTAPVAARIGGVEAVSMDVALAPGGRFCLAAGFGGDIAYMFREDPTRLRLYLVDVPKGLSMQTLLITVMARDEGFEDVIKDVDPIIDSIEFHAP